MHKESPIDKRGSTAVLLSVTFVIMMMAVAAAIIISRRMVVYSECKVFGEVWTKAVLSEYDVHLFEDYGILAYHGPDSEVDKKLRYYLDYSAEGKLDAGFAGISSDLSGYEMNDPDNFRKSLRKALPAAVIDELVNGTPRNERVRHDSSDGEAGRFIVNTVVLDTLPSRGIKNTIDVDALVSVIREKSFRGYLAEKVGGSVAELCFIRKNMNSHLAIADEKASFFENEWEYIINGGRDDSENLRACRRKLFLLRNALNLAYLYSDTEKQAMVTAVAEMISPGAGGLLLRLLINEAWAAAESEYDVDTLFEGGRIPLLKTAVTWHTGINNILDGDEFLEQLDEEGKNRLEEKREEIGSAGDALEVGRALSDGQTYEDHLMILIAAMNENTRLLRIMDIVQIDMKYRYYADFDLQEHYCGVRFTIKANGKEYSFEEEYG